MREQTTRVFKKEKGFAQIDNAVLRDTRLSFGALGLLCHLLSHSEDWTINVSQVRKDRSISKEGLQKLFKELAQYGYAKLHYNRDEKGRILGSTWEVYEEPLISREPENPALGEGSNIRKPIEKNTIGLSNSGKRPKSQKGEAKWEKVGNVNIDSLSYCPIFRRKDQPNNKEVKFIDWSRLDKSLGSRIVPETGEIHD